MDIVKLFFKADASEVDAAQKKVADLGKEVADTERKMKTAEGQTGGFTGAFEAMGGPLGEASSRLKGFKDNIDEMVGAFNGLASVGAAGSLLAVAGAAGVLAAIRFSGTLDDIGDLAEKFGLSASQANLLDQQLKSAGTSIETYYAGLQRVSNALAKADEDGKKASEALNDLGIKVKDGATPVEVLTSVTAEYGAKLREGSVSATEAAALQQVLGRNYREVIVAAEQAATAQERYNSFAQAGVGITKDGVAAAGDYERAQNDVTFVLNAVGSKLVADVIPAFTNLINAFVESYKAGGAVKGAFEAIVFAANVVMVPIRLMIDGFITLDALMTSVGKGLGAIAAAASSGSMAPFKEWAAESQQALDRAAQRVSENKLWGQGTDELAPAKSPAITPPTRGGSGKTGKDNTQAEMNALLERGVAIRSREIDALKALNGENDALLKITRDYDALIAQAESKKFSSVAVKLQGMKEEALNTERQIQAVKEKNKAEEESKRIGAGVAAILQQQQDITAGVNGENVEMIKLEREIAKAESDALAIGNQSLALKVRAQGEMAKALLDARQQTAEEERQAAARAKLLTISQELNAMSSKWMKDAGLQSFNSIIGRSFSPQEQALMANNDLRDRIESESFAKQDSLQTYANQVRDKDPLQAKAIEEQIKTLQTNTEAALATLSLNFAQARKDSDNAWKGMTAGAKAFADSIPTVNKAFSDFAQKGIGEFSNRLVSLITTGKFGFKDMVNSMLQMLAQLTVQLLVVRPLLAAFGLGGAVAGGAIKTQANGGAWSGGVQMFADGGVFGSPTLFRHSSGIGVLGEAGPESVMPLRRNSRGQLGVIAEGTGGGTNIQIGQIQVNVQGGQTNEQTGQVVSSAIVERMRQIADARISDATRSGGIIRRAMA
ncbi:phage tail tape measure protein [Leptothrix discophora]|uniref:Phage tail tape measure C-terminal domain-containing protein n=1 Tax=Leptothrix discophora TaxID=89 RepID=A0ABT9G0E0_LEPDI|nr:phage tail tape measure C-terminal domain-containing protein [Leptothrix discophora]MDP4299931.1 phage tail tape measure C-terminal domain-containing protein [Leptothrix discophora]